MEIPDELLRKIVREALQELGSDADPAVLRKIVKEVIQRLPATRNEYASLPHDLPPKTTTSQY